MAGIGYSAVTQTATTNLFSRDRIVELSRQLDEPEWMLNKRLVAWSVYGHLPAPSKTDPGWRRTDLRSAGWGCFDFQRIEPVLDVAQAGIPASGYAGPAVGPDAGQVAGLMRLVNGRPVVVGFDDNLRRQGLSSSIFLRPRANDPNWSVGIL